MRVGLVWGRGERFSFLSQGLKCRGSQGQDVRVLPRVLAGGDLPEAPSWCPKTCAPGRGMGFLSVSVSAAQSEHGRRDAWARGGKGPGAFALEPQAPPWVTCQTVWAHASLWLEGEFSVPSPAGSDTHRPFLALWSHTGCRSASTYSAALLTGSILQEQRARAHSRAPQNTCGGCGQEDGAVLGAVRLNIRAWTCMLG